MSDVSMTVYGFDYIRSLSSLALVIAAAMVVKSLLRSIGGRREVEKGNKKKKQKKINIKLHAHITNQKYFS